MHNYSHNLLIIDLIGSSVALCSQGNSHLAEFLAERLRKWGYLATTNNGVNKF